MDKHKDIQFTTADDITIYGDLYGGGEKAIILLHMFTVTRKTWSDFSPELQKKGYTVLAIDLRGHGESDLDYEEFSEDDFNNIILDAEAAKNFLGKERVAVIGASIGANTALRFASEVDAIVALSPGLDYKGIDAEAAAGSVQVPTLIVVSSEDTYSAKSSEKLKSLIGGSELKIYSDKGHGTKMLDRETKDFILNWLEENF